MKSKIWASSRADAHLHDDEVPEDVDVPEVAETEEGGEEPAQHHPPRQVVAQGEALPENAAAETGEEEGHR